MTTVRDRPGFDLRLLQQPFWSKPRYQWLLFSYHIHSYEIFTGHNFLLERILLNVGTTQILFYETVFAPKSIGAATQV